uniref:Uncharacterized protein n=1 Tax=Photinus pyralis TaxID=7054 RepID=A0A1Y1KRM1_PHOPY
MFSITEIFPTNFEFSALAKRSCSHLLLGGAPCAYRAFKNYSGSGWLWFTFSSRVKKTRTDDHKHNENSFVLNKTHFYCKKDRNWKRLALVSIKKYRETEGTTYTNYLILLPPLEFDFQFVIMINDIF